MEKGYPASNARSLSSGQADSGAQAKVIGLAPESVIDFDRNG